MPWVSIHEQFDWRAPGVRAMKCFKPGVHFMTRDQAAEAARTGKGKPTRRPDGVKTTKAGGTDGTGDTRE